MKSQIIEIADHTHPVDYPMDQNVLPDITFYTDLASADTIDSLKQQVLHTVKKLGLSDFFFCIPGIRGAGFITTLPAEIYVNFLVGERTKSDLLVEHARKSTSPVFLSNIVSFARSAPVNTEVFQLCSDLFKTMEHYEFYDCYAMPNRSQIGNRNALFLVADRESSVEEFRHKVNRYRSILHLFGEAIANISTGSFPSFFSQGADENRIAITAKPLRLLNVLAKDNITLKNAAIKLNISLDTANKHIAAAKSALGAHTQAAAIYRAIKLGIVCVDE